MPRSYLGHTKAKKKKKKKKKKTEIAHRARTEVSGTQGAALLWTEAN